MSFLLIILLTSCSGDSYVKSNKVKAQLKELVGWKSPISVRENAKGALFYSDEGIYYVDYSTSNKSILINFASTDEWNFVVDTDNSHMFYKIDKFGKYLSVILRDEHDETLINITN